MKKNSFPLLINYIISVLYVLTLVSFFIDESFLLFGLIGVGLYFGPIAFISLIIYRFGVLNYDAASFKKAILYVIFSFIVTGVTLLFINNSMNFFI